MIFKIGLFPTNIHLFTLPYKHYFDLEAFYANFVVRIHTPQKGQNLE